MSAILPMLSSKPAGAGSAPWWLPGGNLQTIWPALFSRRYAERPPSLRRERWTTPDGDFIDVDFVEPAAVPGAPRAAAPRGLVLFHGLEGSPEQPRKCGSASDQPSCSAQWAKACA